MPGVKLREMVVHRIPSERLKELNARRLDLSVEKTFKAERGGI